MLLAKKFDEAFNNNDAAAVAALFTEDAIWVADTGPLYGRQAIEKQVAEWFKGSALQQPHGSRETRILLAL